MSPTIQEVEMSLMSNYEELFKREYQDSYLVQKWKKEIERGQNVNIQGSGTTRSGKSMVTLTICEAMDFAFQDVKEAIKKRFCFTAQQFIDALNTSYSPGSVIVAEEVGTEQSGQKSKLWWDEINMALSDWLQVGGHNAYVIIMNSPFMRGVQTDSRALMTVYIETNRRGINRRRNTNTVKVQEIDVKQKEGKVYYPNYQKDGVKILTWDFPLPQTPGLIDAYEKHSLAMKGIIEDMSGMKIAYREQARDRKYVTAVFIAKKIMENEDTFKKYTIIYQNNTRLRLNRGALKKDFGGSIENNKLTDARQLVEYEWQQRKEVKN